MIKHWTQIKTGDALFKDTDFSDKGKSLPMKFINWITTWGQNAKEKDFKKMEDGDDHTEKFFWIEDILYVASATNKTGVRPTPFERWAKQEGNPRIVIVRRTVPYTTTEEELMTYMMFEDLGLPYALWPGMKALFGKGKKQNIKHVLSILEERGLICSETTAKWDVEKLHWPGMLPKPLHDYYLENGRSDIFDGKVLDLFKRK